MDAAKKLVCHQTKLQIALGRAVSYSPECQLLFSLYIYNTHFFRFQLLQLLSDSATPRSSNRIHIDLVWKSACCSYVGLTSVLTMMFGCFLKVVIASLYNIHTRSYNSIIFYNIFNFSILCTILSVSITYYFLGGLPELQFTSTPTGASSISAIITTEDLLKDVTQLLTTKTCFLQVLLPLTKLMS